MLAGPVSHAPSGTVNPMVNDRSTRPYLEEEDWEDSLEGYPQSAPYEWWNYHDRYGVPA